MSLESSPDYQRKAAFDNAVIRVAFALSLAVVACFSISCTGISGAVPAQSNTGNTGSTSNTSEIKMSLAPSSVTVSSGATQQFTASLTGTSNTAVSWQASAGSISNGGLFTAPSVTAKTLVTVSATSVANKTAASSQVTVVPVSKLSIAARSLAGGTNGVPYSVTLTASGGIAPYQWQISSGTLPQGLTLNQGSGVIAGVTAQTGTFTFTVLVTDSNGSTASQAMSITISASTTGNFDGPAELPRVYIQSAMANTPAPGSVISVGSGGDFQQALNTAKCGDTIQLQAGAVYTGSFTVPAQTCDDEHWIIVRTSAPDSSLPAEGTRATPCYAGVASLPGRPALNCSSTTNVMAKIQYSSTGSGPIVLANGASHYRFIGLEITRVPLTGVVYNLVVHQDEGAADHIYFDRCWLHGTAQDETERGVMFSGTQYGAVIDSYLSDFHCISKTGACMDAQAVAGGIGSLPSGPLKVHDDFLEASGEGILLGGDAATTTPTDIEVDQDHFFKPMTWMVGQPGYVGGADGNPFIVKNHFELKNAQRVLFEGNILDDTWGGFSQAGFAIVLTPKNQAIGTENVCPICQVTDVTIRYVTASHMGGTMVLGNGLSSNGGVPLAGGRYSIHDLIADDIDAAKYDGYGTFAQVSMGTGAPVLQSVTINHVTAFEDGVMLNLGDDVAVNPQMTNFVFTNNLINAGSSPTQTTGGGTTNCGYRPAPITSLPACFQPYTFTHNAFIASPSNFPASKYPSGNFFPASASTVGFVNYNGGNGGNYQLQSSSPYVNAGTDGQNLGANVAAVMTAIVGVE